MNNYNLEKSLMTIVVVLVAISFIIISKKIIRKTKYTGKVKTFLTIIVASICSLLFFYPFAIIDDQLGIGNEYITGMARLFLPLSLYLLFIFTILFFVYRNKNRGEWKKNS
ncbi:MAG: hypothetical protein K0S26_505 [Bacteroidota bacterium]|nr:hypothetical protein [Bacteroidota bacterium]